MAYSPIHFSGHRPVHPIYMGAPRNSVDTAEAIIALNRTRKDVIVIRLATNSYQTISGSDLSSVNKVLGPLPKPTDKEAPALYRVFAGSTPLLPLYGNERETAQSGLVASIGKLEVISADKQTELVHIR
jgi:hypothetical protein